MDEVLVQQALPLGNWDELIGHEQERRRLVRGGTFASLLFSGPQGLGKRLLAAWYGAYLNCGQPPEGPPWRCECPNCRLVLKNSHPDVVWLERLPGKLSLGVGEARELIHQLYLRPYQARSRICIISEAERLTDEAQSALLKTLEEPPDGNVLVLVTSQESRLLPTVQSRCRIHRFRPVEDPVLMSWLQQKGCPADSAARYAGLAQGSPGKAVSLWEQPALWEALEQLLDALQEVPGSTLGRCLELAARCETLKVPGLEGRSLLEWILQSTQAYFRDALLVQSGATHIIHRHRQAQLEQLVKKQPAIQSWLAILKEANEYAEANVNVRLLLQDLFLKLRR
ncbi:MAG: DNA polymerase III subunit delta' [Vulcanimicrobiota bacterium]